jgi:hypothetical protein
MNRIWAILAVTLTLWALPLQAHETTRSYVTLTRTGGDIAAIIRVAFRDIEVVVWIDEDLDGAVTWGEAKARLPAASTYLLSVLNLSAGGDCALSQSGASVSDSGGVAYLDINFRGTCPSATAPLQVTSRLFADVDPDHRMFLTVVAGAAQSTAILSAGSPSFVATAAAGGLTGIFLSYLKAGIAHLAGGFDHVVFLLMLMLPAVTVQPDKRRAVVQVVTAITGFTLAHALTLTAASTNLLRPATDLITFLVAGSIMITAIDNIRPFLPGPRAAVAAFFGLIHGFGFATVLSGSAMTGGVFATALFGFNLGIELAQIGVVGATLFALMALRGGRVLLWLGSSAGIAAGGFWILVAGKLI